MRGRIYNLEKNDGENTNHSGSCGAHHQNFQHYVNNHQVILMTQLFAEKTGFPGTVILKVIYSWNNQNELRVDYKASANKKTPISITNHSYFNLTAFKSSLSKHVCYLNASHRLERCDDYLVTGTLQELSENLSHIYLKNLIHSLDEVDPKDNSYYIFNKYNQANGCILIDDFSGRKLTIRTSYPGYQFYSGFLLRSETKGWYDKKIKPFDALCIEPHNYPDFINHNHFPQVFVSQKSQYSEYIIYAFSTSV